MAKIWLDIMLVILIFQLGIFDGIMEKKYLPIYFRKFQNVDFLLKVQLYVHIIDIKIFICRY